MFFCENRHTASFNIKEKTQKYKFEIWVLKTTILDPQKARFWFLLKNPPTNLFFVFRLWFSIKNNWRTNVLLVSIFEYALIKKLLAIKNAILTIFGS